MYYKSLKKKIAGCFFFMLFFSFFFTSFKCKISLDEFFVFIFSELKIFLSSCYFRSKIRDLLELIFTYERCD